MNKKMSKRQKDIKSKLMAAICMLLVSSIMMVSTTYAWFTLSTAPEVTGISTAVGANGNLEMALMPLSGKTEDITSNVGDSMNVKDKTLANTTWGNLVELRTAYGLEKITLYPSALNYTDEEKTTINMSFPVETPEYGVDGRVTDLVEEAQLGSYDGTSFKDKVTVNGADNQSTTIENFKGVRAIGTVSGATQAQLDYKAALVNASSAATNAQKKASGALVEKGGDLADIAVRHAMNNDVYTQDDVINLQYMVDAVQDSHGIIEDAIKEYIVAAYISQNSGSYTEETVDSIRNATSLSDTAIADYIPASFNSMIEQLNTSINNANVADEKLTALTSDDSLDWNNDIGPVVEKLANPSMMQLNGYAVTTAKQNLNAIMQDYISNGNLILTLQSGAGVFVDIADFCGDYAASILITQISYEGVGTFNNIPATMQTQSNVCKPYDETNNPSGQGNPYLTVARNTVNNSYPTPGGAAANASLPLSDFYGYIIDLAFRTNVAGSNLQLQTAAVDRIYSDNTTNENTMGGGSTMIFKSNDANFTAAKMIDLMKHLKVVLFDPADGEIIKHLKITDVSTEITTAADGTVTAPLYVADAAGNTAYKLDEDGAQLKDEDGNPIIDPTIMALDQNAIYQLSALVYLDGTDLTNADVANAARSMAGALNLQFSSSADLEPMEYADLRNGTVTAPEGGNTPVVKDVTTGTITGGYAATINHIAVGTTYKLVAVVTETTGSTPVTTGTVTIGGETATYETYGGVSGWVVDATETAPTEAVNVTVA